MKKIRNIIKLAHKQTGIIKYIAPNVRDITITSDRNEALVIGSTVAREKYFSMALIQYGDEYNVELEEV